MGPRQGSPAAETHIGFFITPSLTGAAVIFICLLFLGVSSSAAQTARASHRLNIIIGGPPEIGLSEENPGFQGRGSASSGIYLEESQYRIRQSQPENGSTEALLTTKLEGAPDGAQFTARVGSFDSDNSSGGSVSGTVPVQWKVDSRAVLSAGAPAVVFLTVKDN